MIWTRMNGGRIFHAVDVEANMPVAKRTLARCGAMPLGRSRRSGWQGDSEAPPEPNRACQDCWKVVYGAKAVHA